MKIEQKEHRIVNESPDSSQPISTFEENFL